MVSLCAPQAAFFVTNLARHADFNQGRLAPYLEDQLLLDQDLFEHHVEVVDGVATKVEPNFDLKGEHPADGKVCVKPFGLIQKLYNPHRIKKPMKRTNPKKGRDEDPGWVEIEWEEALDIVAEKMNAAREKGIQDENGNPRLAFTTG